MPPTTTATTPGGLKSAAGVQKGEGDDRIVLLIEDDENVEEVQPEAQHPKEPIGVQGIGLRGSAGGLIGSGEGARSGKLEHSILNFKMTYPNWQPEGKHKEVLVNFLESMDEILYNHNTENNPNMNKSMMGTSVMGRGGLWGSGGWDAMSRSGHEANVMGSSVLASGGSGREVAAEFADEDKDAMTKSFLAWKRQALSLSDGY